MALFSKRLTCFYCGGRSNQPIQSLNKSVRKFHCEHCEADNYLDQVSFADWRLDQINSTNDVVLL